MPAWPSTLSTKALAGSHRFKPRPNVVAFQPDAGEPLRRRRYTGRASEESFAQKLSAVQLQALQNFWAIDCQQGVLSFTATLIDRSPRKWWFDPEQPFEASNIAGGTYYLVVYNMGCRR